MKVCGPIAASQYTVHGRLITVFEEQHGVDYTRHPKALHLTDFIEGLPLPVELLLEAPVKSITGETYFDWMIARGDDGLLLQLYKKFVLHPKKIAGQACDVRFSSKEPIASLTRRAQLNTRLKGKTKIRIPWGKLNKAISMDTIDDPRLKQAVDDFFTSEYFSRHSVEGNHQLMQFVLVPLMDYYVVSKIFAFPPQTHVVVCVGHVHASVYRDVFHYLGGREVWSKKIGRDRALNLKGFITSTS